MPRFFFDAREGSAFSRDDDGLEFPDETVAEREAAKAVAAIGSDLLPSGKVQEVSIEVRNKTGQRLVAVSVSMRVERFDR